MQLKHAVQFPPDREKNNHLDKYNTIIVNKYDCLFYNLIRVGTTIFCYWSCL